MCIQQESTKMANMFGTKVVRLLLLHGALGLLARMHLYLGVSTWTLMGGISTVIVTTHNIMYVSGKWTEIFVYLSDRRFTTLLPTTDAISYLSGNNRLTFGKYFKFDNYF